MVCHWSNHKKIRRKTKRLLTLIPASWENKTHRGWAIWCCIDLIRRIWARSPVFTNPFCFNKKSCINWANPTLVIPTSEKLLMRESKIMFINSKITSIEYEFIFELQKLEYMLLKYWNSQYKYIYIYGNYIYIYSNYIYILIIYINN